MIKQQDAIDFEVAKRLDLYLHRHSLADESKAQLTARIRADLSQEILHGLTTISYLELMYELALRDENVKPNMVGRHQPAIMAILPEHYKRQRG